MDVTEAEREKFNELAYQIHCLGPEATGHDVRKYVDTDLDYLGQGIARFVFDLGDYVLKTAQTTNWDDELTCVGGSGLVQNMNEANRRDEFGIEDPQMFADIVAYHENYLWVVQEKAEIGTEISAAEKTDIELTLAADTDMSRFDLSHDGNFGRIDGELLIVDFGWWPTWDDGKDYQGLVEAGKSAIESMFD